MHPPFPSSLTIRYLYGILILVQMCVCNENSVVITQGLEMLLTLKQASQWASKHLNKNVTTANISYLIQYGHIEASPEKGQH